MPEYIEREAAIKELINDAPEQVNYSREDASDCIRYVTAADVVSTDLISEKMYDFYQKAVARTDVSADYLDGIYDMMDYIARWIEEEK